MDRRSLLLGSAATAMLAACGGGPPGPATVAVSVVGQPGMNPGPDGADRPVTLSLLRLRDAGAFNAADFFALQEDPATALAAEMLGIDVLTIPPGGSAEKTLTFEPEATQLGLLALLRDPTGKVWRAAVPVPAGAALRADVTLGPTGIGLGVT